MAGSITTAGAALSRVGGLQILALCFLLAGASHGADLGLQTGTATWSGPPDGARNDYSAMCGFGETVITAPFNSFVTGFAVSKECGVCYKVTCKGHPACSVEGVTVTVTDACRDPRPLCEAHYLPPSPPTHFDMAGHAFGAMALPGRADELRAATAAGPVTVTFEVTNCIYSKLNPPVVYPAFRPYGDATNEEFVVTLIYIEWMSFYPAVVVRLKNAGDTEWRTMQHFQAAACAFRDDDEKFLPVTPPLSIRVDTAPVGAKDNSTELKTVIAQDVIPVGFEPGKIYYNTA